MASTDFNMLRLEAPRNVLQITDGTEQAEETLEVANPATWLCALAKQQKQAEQDLAQLVHLCGNTVDHADQRIQQIEQAYRDLSDGTRYVYDRLSANQRITGEWIRSELAGAASAYQAFAHNVWGAIIERTLEADQKQIGQTTQLARLNDSISFLAEANVARSQHLANFQGNVELGAEEHQKRADEQQQRVEYLERQLQEAREEARQQAEALQLLAARIPAPETPRPPATAARSPPPEPAPWRSPVRATTSSLADALQQLRAGPSGSPSPDAQRPPVPPRPARRTRPPAVSPAPKRNPMFGGGGMPPQPPRRPLPPPPSPSPPPSPRPAQRTLTTEELARTIARAVAEGVTAAAPATPAPAAARVNTSRLKMKNPDSFNGKNTTNFNQWWESVTMYLGFYPETVDRQKIAWIGTLLTDTALSWHLHHYRDLGEADTWVNYSAAIRAEYHNDREAADAQQKLGQLRYQGCIRTYITELRSLNNFARANGESLREKVDLAMTDAILDMRFSQNEGEFIDDDDFIHATYRAGIQVEKRKALRATRELVRSTAPPKHEAPRKAPASKTPNQEEKPRDPQQKGAPRTDRKTQYNQPGHWVSKEAALTGVPAKEREEYGRSNDDCWRCGRSGHRTYECFAGSTKKGTSLPTAPWKVSAVHGEKRKRSEEPEAPIPAKQQKVAAVEVMDTAPLWEESDSDF